MPRGRSKRNDRLVKHVLLVVPAPSEDRARADRIAARAKLSRTETFYQLKAMRQLGLIELRRHQGYYLTEKGCQQRDLVQRQAGEQPPGDAALEQRLWNGMRTLRKWCAAELTMLAFAPEDTQPEQRAELYTELLLRAELIQALPARPDQAPRFRLAHDLGPTAPSWRESYAALWDWNAGRPVLPATDQAAVS